MNRAGIQMPSSFENLMPRGAVLPRRTLRRLRFCRRACSNRLTAGELRYHLETAGEPGGCYVR
jgi:hypothetical protein